MKCEDCEQDKPDVMLRALDSAQKKGEPKDATKTTTRALCTACVVLYPGREWMTQP